MNKIERAVKLWAEAENLRWDIENWSK